MADCYSEDTSDLRGLHTPTRNNYFYGKLLDVQHFTLEQRYGNHKRWLLNRLGFGSGVMCGLRLEVIDGQLILQPGVAIDPLGREIIVPAAVAVDPYHLTDACGKKIKAVGGGTTMTGSGSGVSGIRPDNDLVTICLAYHPCETEMVPVLVSDCESREACAPSIIRESFAVLVQEGGAKPAMPECAVPNLFTPGAGASRADPIDMFARILGRVDEPCVDGGREPCVVLGDIMLPAQGSALVDADVSYTGRQVVLNNQLLFDLLLCLWERVEQCCAPVATPAPATAAPTISPGVPTPPPATVPPTPEPPATVAPPPPLLRVRDVRILNLSPEGINRIQTLALMRPGDDPANPLVVKSSSGPNAIQVRFDGPPVVLESVIPDETFIVRRFNADGPFDRVPGNIVPVDPIDQTNMVRFEPQPNIDVAARFVPGRYQVTLKGDAPAIMSRLGLPLDGEPKQLPSGNNIEGGDFVFELIVE